MREMGLSVWREGDGGARCVDRGLEVGAWSFFARCVDRGLELGAWSFFARRCVDRSLELGASSLGVWIRAWSSELGASSLGVWIGAWSSELGASSLVCGSKLVELCVCRVRVREQMENF